MKASRSIERYQLIHSVSRLAQEGKLDAKLVQVAREEFNNTKPNIDQKCSFEHMLGYAFGVSKRIAHS